MKFSTLTILSFTLAISAAAMTVAPADAQSLYASGQDRPNSLYQDWRPPRAGGIGDILTILVMESTSATNSANIETSKENSIDIGSIPGTGALKFIPGIGLVSDASTDYKGEGTQARSQTIQARVSVTVVGKKPNGDLIIEGSRMIEVNGEHEIVYLSGSVNPKIIPANNTIESFRVADLQVSYKGRGVLQTGSRPGLLIRVFNWFF